jgi:hypothetical protein
MQHSTDLEKVDSVISTESTTEVRNFIEQLSESAQELADKGDWEALVTGLLPLQQIIADMRLLEKQVKDHIIETIPERKVAVPGVGIVERFRKTTRKNWDSEELLRFVVQKALVDQVTGEIPSSPVEAIDRVLTEIRACVPFTGSTAWRVGALRERGFDPDEWCDQDTEGYSLKFIRSDNQEK